MPDLRSYAAEIEREIRPPQFVALQQVARARARARATTCLAAVAIAVGAVVTVSSGDFADRTLPAVTPTPVPTPTDVEGLRSLTPEDIVASGAKDALTIRPRDGHPATVHVATLCLNGGSFDQVEPPARGTCRSAWEVVNDDKRSWTPAAADMSGLVIPQYVGDGIFVHALWGHNEPRSYTVDADTMTVTELNEGTTSPGPGPGRHLISCGLAHLGCVVDLRAGHLDLLDRASLPLWFSQLHDPTWQSVQSGILPVTPLEGANEGLVVLGGGLGTDSPEASTPLLVSSSMSKAIPLTIGKPVAPTPGLSWIAGKAGTQDCPCVLDRDKATISQIDLPPNAIWAHSTTDGFWGLRSTISTHTAVRVDAGGEEHTHDLVIEDANAHTQIADGATRAMAYYVTHQDGSSQLHVSVDRGVTWQIRAVPREERDSTQNGKLLPTWATWPPAG